MRIRVIVAALAVSSLALPVAHAQPEGDAVAFEVTNLHTLDQATIHGTLFSPECDASTVVVLMHGLSYTRAAWNHPGYSVVDPILDAGYAVITIDRLGYGQSVLANGYDILSEGHAFIAAQIVEQLGADYDQVVLGGHSAGAETTLLAAGLYKDLVAEPDAILALGYHHVPSEQIVTDFMTGDTVRAAQDDYEYFLGTPEHRAWMFYTEHADQDVIDADTDAAVLTPSGEILSIGKQPSRYVLAAIEVPVFLQLGDSDILFPVEHADLEASLFVSAASVDVDVVEDAGHTFMLHPTGPAGSSRLADWLVGSSGTVGC